MHHLCFLIILLTVISVLPFRKENHSFALWISKMRLTDNHKRGTYWKKDRNFLLKIFHVYFDIDITWCQKLYCNLLSFLAHTEYLIKEKKMSQDLWVSVCVCQNTTAEWHCVEDPVRVVIILPAVEGSTCSLHFLSAYWRTRHCKLIKY